MEEIIKNVNIWVNIASKTGLPWQQMIPLTQNFYIILFSNKF